MRATIEALLAELDSILEAENAALAHMDVGAVAALAAEKNALAEQLRIALAGSGREEARAAIRDCGAGLRSAMDDNKVLLERAMRVQRRVIGLIASASEPVPTVYGRRGVHAGAGGPRAMVASA